MSSIFRSQIWSVLALSGGLATAADAGIIITLTDNGDDTIGFSMSGDFTIYANHSDDRQGAYGSYLGPENGTISNTQGEEGEVTNFAFLYTDAGGDASGSVAAAFGSGEYALKSFAGSGHLFQNFTVGNFYLDRTLTSHLAIGGAVTGGVISGISASGTYVGSFASVGISAGTAVTRYGSDASNYDTITINTQAANASAVPGPLSLAVLGAGVGLSRRRRSR